MQPRSAARDSVRTIIALLARGPTRNSERRSSAAPADVCCECSMPAMVVILPRNGSAADALQSKAPGRFPHPRRRMPYRRLTPSDQHDRVSRFCGPLKAPTDREGREADPRPFSAPLRRGPPDEADTRRMDRPTQKAKMELPWCREGERALRRPFAAPRHPFPVRSSRELAEKLAQICGSHRAWMLRRAAVCAHFPVNRSRTGTQGGDHCSLNCAHLHSCSPCHD